MERSGNLCNISKISKSCFKKYFYVHNIFVFKFYYIGKNLFLNVVTASKKKQIFSQLKT